MSPEMKGKRLDAIIREASEKGYRIFVQSEGPYEQWYFSWPTGVESTRFTRFVALIDTLERLLK